MPFNIKVTNPETNTSWMKALTEDEFNNLRPAIKGHESVSPIKAMLIPVRSNSAKNFAKDFFFPTLFNRVLTVDQAVKRIFPVLLALALDTLTFPIRLLTCIPRVISNALLKPTAFENALQAYNIDPKVTEASYVKVKLQWEVVRSCNLNHWVDEDGEHFTSGKDQCCESIYINLIPMPDLYKSTKIASRFTT